MSIKLWLSSLTFFLAASITTVQAADETIKKMKTRSDGMFRMMIIDPGQYDAAVILLQGGKGRLKIKDDGIRGGKNNFLIYFRDHFVDNGLLVAVADAPKDYYEGEAMRVDNFRLSQEHADDLGAVISELRVRTDKPIWLVGTSRGSISAVNAASRLSGNSAPNGLVLTSSVVTTTHKGFPNVFDVDLSGISVPLLITHHVDDACGSSMYKPAVALKDAFPASSTVEFRTYEGGDEGKHKHRCKRKSAHGYYGQEKKVLDEIIAWIKSHS